MPYIFQTHKINIPREPGLDKRVKLTDKDRAAILSLYREGKMSIREIARKVEKIASRRSIQFIIFPDRINKEARSKYMKEYHKRTYPLIGKGVHAKKMREFNRRKRDLLNGLGITKIKPRPHTEYDPITGKRKYHKRTTITESIQVTIENTNQPSI